jgi:pimeloyl-ACP methyl ester carboxylesterase
MRSHASDRCERLVLKDGRSLVYTVTGPPDGSPVFYCHGAIGTPVDATVDLQRITRQAGIRYIAPSRPGVGGSDPQPGRTVLDFADDLDALADALGLERFSVVGVSAGGPYALAAAHRLAHRVERVALCSALAPFCPPHRTPGLQRRIRLPLAVLAGAPGLVRGLGDTVLPVVARHPELITRVIAAHAAPSERERLARSDERAAASRSFLDATCAGAGGLIDDFLTYAFGWGFDPREIQPEVHLWHGAGDPLVPVEHALQLAAALPNCRVFVDPDEGHHFFRSGLGEILAALVAPDQVAVSSLDARELRAA